MLLSSQPVVGGRHTNNTAEIQVNKLNYIRSVRTSSFHLITFVRPNIIQSPCGAFLLPASSLNLFCRSACLRFAALAVYFVSVAFLSRLFRHHSVMDLEYVFFYFRKEPPQNQPFPSYSQSRLILGHSVLHCQTSIVVLHNHVLNWQQTSFDTAFFFNTCL